MKSSIYKFSFFAISFFGVFVLFPVEKRGVLVAVLGLASLIYFIKERKFKFTKTLLINSSLVLIYGISLFYSSSIIDSLKRFETALPIILFPIIFSILYSSNENLFSDKMKRCFFWVFYFSSLLFVIIIIIYFCYLGYFSTNNSYGYYLSNLNGKLPFLNDHPIYISSVFSVSVLLSVSEFETLKTSRKKIVLLIVSNLILISAIFFLSRRGVIIALFLSILLVVLFLFKRQKKKLAIIVLSMFTGTMLFLLLPQTNKRIIEFFNKKTYNITNETNSTNNRLQIYKCAFELIKEKPIMGYGIEDDRKALNNCYKENLYYLYQNQFNTHNQYLAVAMKTGIIGLLIFLYFLFYNFKLSYINKDWVSCGIITFFGILMLFENILERQNGVMLFAFLINFFAFKNIIINDNKKLQ